MSVIFAYVPSTSDGLTVEANPIYHICKACGYVERDIPRREDDAHGELCCQNPRENCLAKTTPGAICVTHDVWPA